MNSVVADKQDVGLLSLPPEIFASVLSLFCNGKSISTFLLASQASNSFDGFETVQGALVERYERLSQRVADENVRDTLDLLIQQLLTCERDSPAAMKLFSERCAVLDYFEAHLEFGHHWLIWCGEFESFYGRIRAYITSPYWSISAISRWYRDLELSEFSLVRPRVEIDKPASYPFGSIIGRGEFDGLVIDRLREKLEDNYVDAEYWKGMLTALHFAYEVEPPLVVTTQSYPILEGQESAHLPGWATHSKSLCCYWDDSEQGFDDSDLENLGGHLVRLMQRFMDTAESGSDSFQASWLQAVADHQKEPPPFPFQ